MIISIFSSYWIKETVKHKIFCNTLLMLFTRRTITSYMKNADFGKQIAYVMNIRQQKCT